MLPKGIKPQDGVVAEVPATRTEYIVLWRYVHLVAVARLKWQLRNLDGTGMRASSTEACQI